jgi:hypothetical protein
MKRISRYLLGLVTWRHVAILERTVPETSRLCARGV